MTYENNFGITPLNCDIAEITGKTLLKAAALSKGKLDVLIGCPPCQGFTNLRHNCTDDPRNELVKVYGRIVKDVMPKFVIFENVPGMVLQNNKKYFDGFVRMINRLGYRGVYWILQAADYGAPQFRRRLIAVAAREKKYYEKLKRPEQTHAHQSKAESLGLKPWKTVREAFKGLPPLRSGQRSTKVPNHVAPAHTERILKLIRLIPKDGGSRTELPRGMWLRCHRNHRGHKDVYGRMKWDEPAPCITCGCRSASKGRYIHPTQDRTITAREAARLQCFPDSDVFCGGFFSWGRQIGNAMPVLLAQAVAESVKENIFR
jgi:DNA (cytosine-5)-methyltransferase 1